MKLTDLWDWEAHVLPRIEDAIWILQRRDGDLFEDRIAGERAIAHRLGLFLQHLFPTFDVDCEYNRMGEDPKLPKRIRGELRRESNETDEELATPDICIHRRGKTNRENNLLVVEVKIEGNNSNVDSDWAKLKAFTSGGEKFTYQHGLWLVFGKRGSITKANYYAKGKKYTVRPDVFPEA